MTEPKFVPKPGQIDYTYIRRAPVMNCLVCHGDRFLIVRRADDLRFYPGAWNGVSGFLDDERSPVEKIKEELEEELGIAQEQIVSIEQGPTVEQVDESIDKVWVVHPLKIMVTTDQVRLDWEAQGHAWVTPEEVWSYQLLPGFDKVIETFFPRKS